MTTLEQIDLKIFWQSVHFMWHKRPLKSLSLKNALQKQRNSRSETRLHCIIVEYHSIWNFGLFVTPFAFFHFSKKAK